MAADTAMNEDRARAPGGGAAAARYAYLGLMLVLTAMALMQFFWVGLSMFESPARWVDHRTTGHVFGLITYVVWVPAVLGRLGRGQVIASVALLVMAHLQYAFIGIDSGIVNALHPLNGSLILVLCFWMSGSAIRVIRTARRSASAGLAR